MYVYIVYIYIYLIYTIHYYSICIESRENKKQLLLLKATPDRSVLDVSGDDAPSTDFIPQV